MKKTTTLCLAAALTIFSASEAIAEEASSLVVQGSAAWTRISRERSAPWLGTNKNPNSGKLTVAPRLDIKDGVILLEVPFSLGLEYLNQNQGHVQRWTELIGIGIGPVARINHGLIHFEAGVSLGPQLYNLRGYTRDDKNGIAYGYSMTTWGIEGNAYIRAGLGRFFIGSSLSLENPVGGEPGEPKYSSAGSTQSVDTVNVPTVAGKTQANLALLLGLWL